jgi:membrane protease YdiL (CAAX protease family)
MNTSSALRRHGVGAFFVLSLLAWGIWVPQAAHRFGFVGWAPSLQSPLNALAVWAPGLAAIVLVSLARGNTTIGLLFSTLTKWRVSPRWYFVALLFEPLKWLLAHGFDRLVGRVYELGPAPLLSSLGASGSVMVPVAILFTLPNSLGEELGWRAYALPRLQERHGALVASIILGLFWGFWHIPMWIAWRSGEVNWVSILLMVINMVPVAILFTWIYNGTGRSLLLACLFHASMATKGYLLPRLPTLTETVILWLVAASVVALGGILRTPPAGDAPTDKSERPNTRLHTAALAGPD